MNIKFKILLKSLRIYQWSKNILLFVPLLLAHKYTEVYAIQNTILAFFSFNFIASAVYLINDYFDLETDKKHETKKLRPLANGELSVLQYSIIATVILILGVITSAYISINFIFVIVFYFILSNLYSYKLKKIILVDVFVLTAFYIIRIIAGAIAIEVKLSFWILAFSLFFFLSLALLKRYVELSKANNTNQKKLLSSRTIVYYKEDLLIVNIIGIVSGILSIVIILFFINSETALNNYKTPELIWFIAPILLYWISSLWFIAHRNKIDYDPVYYVVRSKTNWIIMFAILTLILVSKVW